MPIEVDGLQTFGALTRVGTVQPTDIIPGERAGAPISMLADTLRAFILAAIADGSGVTFGVVAPDNATGSQGDVYIRTTGEIYSRSATTWDLQIDFVSQAELTTAISGLVTTTALTTAITNHQALTDPHPTYLTQTEGDARYPLSTVLDELIDDRAGALFVAGANITLTYNDTANTFTIASTASGGGGASGLQYTYSTTAGAGVISATDLTIATTLAINATDATPGGGENAATVLGRLKNGAIFQLTKDPSNYVRYLATGDYVSGSVAVSVDAVAGVIAANDTVYLSIVSDAVGSNTQLISSSLSVFGDSVAVGTGAAVGDGFANKLATATGWAFTNNAVGSTEIVDAATSIFGSSVADQYIVAFGLNDLSWRHQSAIGKDIFANAVLACSAWLALPKDKKTTAKNASTYSGGWSDGTNFGISKRSSTSGSTLNFEFNGDSLLIGYTRLASGTGSFEVSIDGGTATTVAGANSEAARSGISYSPDLSIISGLNDTIHTATITVSSGTVELIYLSGVSSESYSFGKHNVFVGNIIEMTASSFSTPAAPSNIRAIVGQWNSALKAKIASLTALGIRYVNINANFLAADFAADNQHPNKNGHIAIANTYLHKILSIPELRSSGITRISSNNATITALPSEAVSGENIVILGSNFTGATAVMIGGSPATSYTVNSPSQITATTPAFQPGVVAVTTPQGIAVSSSRISRIVFLSEMNVYPPIDLAGHTINAGGTAPGLQTTNFNSAPASLDFSAGNLNFSLANDELLDGDFEISVWVRPTTIVGDEREIFCTRSNATQSDVPIELLLEIQQNGTLRFRLANTQTSVTNFDIYSAASQMTVNTSHIITASVVGSTATLKKDGTIIASGTVSGTRSATNNVVMIGAQFAGAPFTNRFFIGQLDSFKIKKI